MRIAVYMPPVSEAASARHGEDRFVQEALQRIIIAHPEHTFILFSNRPADKSFPAAPHVQRIPLDAQGRHAFALHRLNRKLAAMLKKHGGDVLLSFGGFFPLKSSVPACLVVQEMPFTAGTAADARSRYPRRCRRYLTEAGAVAVLSEYCKKEFTARFGIPGDKISVIHRGIQDDFRPLTWEERESVKSEYTDGCEYIIYVGPIHPEKNIISLMKAFSVLKKRLRSNMMLVLAGTLDPGYKDFPELLRTYQFRDAVKMPGYTQSREITRLIGAAYALVCPSGFDAPVLEAMKCRVPVLAAAGGTSEETGGDAAVYFKAADVEEMGNIFCEIYKNENLRARLIASADEQAAKFTWDDAAELLWSCLLQAKK